MSTILCRAWTSAVKSGLDLPQNDGKFNSLVAAIARLM